MKTNQPKLLLFALVFSLFYAQAQEKKTTTVPKRIYTTKAVTKAPTIDGLLNDESWNIEKSPTTGCLFDFLKKPRQLYGQFT